MRFNNDLTTFKAYSHCMGTFDRLSFANSKLHGRAIRFITRQTVNHTGVVMRFNKPGWMALAEADPEVMVIDLERKIREYTGAIWWHPLKKEFRKKRAGLGKKVQEYTGIQYDWLGLIAQAFKRVRPNAKNMFCSEMVFLAGAFLEPIPLPVPDKFRRIAPQPGSEMDELGWWEPGIRIV